MKLIQKFTLDSESHLFEIAKLEAPEYVTEIELRELKKGLTRQAVEDWNAQITYMTQIFIEVDADKCPIPNSEGFFICKKIKKRSIKRNIL